MTQRYALVGHPIDASPSPAMHNAAFNALGLDATYALRPSTPEDVPAIVADLRSGALDGVNVTTPLKTHFVEHAELTEIARRAGAVNTLWCDDGVLRGALTDVEGIRTPLTRAGFSGGRALILGAGGAARAACVALEAWDIRVDVAARSPKKAEDLLRVTPAAHKALELSSLTAPGALTPYDAILQATPIGRQGEAHALHWESCPQACIAFEMLYLPRQTPFLKDAASRGCPTIEGIRMLVAQGAASFALWTGREPPIEVMEEATRMVLDI